MKKTNTIYFNNSEQNMLLDCLAFANEKHDRVTYMSEFYKICDAYYTYFEHTNIENRHIEDMNTPTTAQALLIAVCDCIDDVENKEIAMDVAFALTKKQQEIEQSPKKKSKIMKNR